MRANPTGPTSRCARGGAAHDRAWDRREPRCHGQPVGDLRLPREEAYALASKAGVIADQRAGVELGVRHPGERAVAGLTMSPVVERGASPAVTEKILPCIPPPKAERPASPSTCERRAQLPHRRHVPHRRRLRRLPSSARSGGARDGARRAERIEPAERQPVQEPPGEPPSVGSAHEVVLYTPRNCSARPSFSLLHPSSGTVTRCRP
jgi:hypothetical protein